MDLKDTFTVEAPSEQVWALFWDFPKLAACLPGCESIERIDDSNFKAQVAQKVGPFKIALDMKLTLDEVQENKSVTFSGGGSDKRGNNLKIGRAALELNPVSASETSVSYDMDFTLFGKLGTLGNSIVKRKVEEMRGEFTRRLKEAVAAG